MNALSDNECALLARHGNDSAMAEIVTRHTPGVFNLLSRLLSDRDQARDATQEVFYRAYRSLDRFDGQHKFRSWLYAIAYNYARDVLRRRKRRNERTFTVLAGSADGDGGVEAVDTRALTPDEAVSGKEQRELVRAALGELEVRERALLVLREMEGLSYEELADLLGCRVGTVKSGLYRARMSLKKELRRRIPGFSLQ